MHVGGEGVFERREVGWKRRWEGGALEEVFVFVSVCFGSGISLRFCFGPAQDGTKPVLGNRTCTGQACMP